jgi:hypothetical protein
MGLASEVAVRPGVALSPGLIHSHHPMIDPNEQQTWPLRVVQPGSHAPAAGVPVSLLDAAGNPAGYWVSDAQGLVPIPRIDATTVRLRVGLRSEEPLEVSVAMLEGGNAEVAAPTSLLPAPTEQRVPAAGARTLAPVEAVGHDLTLRFSRLAVLPLEEEAETTSPTLASQSPIDFFESPAPATRGVRYGALVELELYWQSLGYAAGDLLYTGTLAGGEELAFDVYDARWRWSWGPTRAASRPARPVELIARLIAGSTLANALTTEDGALPLDPFTLPPSTNGTGLSNAAVECVRELLERTGHAASTLRRRALRVSEAMGPSPNGAVRRVIKNPDAARPLGVHFFEPVERFRIGARAARVRPAVLIPFQLPNLATRATVQRFATPMRRVLLDRTLLPDLDWVIGIGRKPLEPDVAPPVSELRIVVQTDPHAAPMDLRQVWLFLHADQTRYAVHFFPADPPTEPTPGLAPQKPSRWIGYVRAADFHQQPLKFPGHLALENGTRVVLSFAALHVEGRAGDSWKRLLSIRDFVLNKESQAHLASLAALADVPGVDPRESRLLGHIAANLPYYAAALIAAGDPTLRYLALSKVVDKDGRSLADMIENRVVGIVGNYIACPLRTPNALPAAMRDRFAGLPAIRSPAEITITVPIPGLWLSQQAASQNGEAPAATELLPDDQRERRMGGRWRSDRAADAG